METRDEARERESCTKCAATLRERDVLIEYDRSDGPAAFAECPNCRVVVRVPSPVPSSASK